VTARVRHDRLLGIQAGRGIAALLVVLFHAGHEIGLPQYAGYIPLHDSFECGISGVDFFFTLSGFIIYFVHHSDIGDPRALPRYAWRRLTRIYPIYWIVTAFALVEIAVGGHGPPEAGYLIRSLLLLPQKGLPLVGPAWTLEHEMLFYIVFAVLIAGRRLGFAVVAGWIVLSLGSLFVAYPGMVVQFAAAFYHVQFLMGALAARVVLTRDIRSPLRLALVGIACFFAVCIAENMAVVTYGTPLTACLLGLSSALIVTGIASAEMHGAVRFGPIAEFVGGMSYVLYLTHPTTIGISYKAFAWMGAYTVVPGWALELVASAGACCAAGLLYRLVERPIMDTLAAFGRTHVYAHPTSPAAPRA
jgi:exopolysaccharide production protein ExoZ